MDNQNLLNDIKLAMKNHELVAYYQPQYDALTNRLVSAEALVRWIKPDGTFITPVQFIPVAEDTDLILDIDWYMLEEVCSFLKNRIDNRLRYVKVSVNFSRKHLVESSFRERLCKVVDNYKIPHNLIEVELTESALMENPKNMIDLIADIRKHEFDVAIDDFGSGLSSLSLIKDISANVLKIDKSLLSGNCENEKERIVLESIFNFAHRLNLTTIAEGVETKEQLGFLRTCDCKLIQGFIFAKPMPKNQFGELCSNNVLTEEMEDILSIQAPASVTQLLMQVIFMKYPLVIMSNLTRNSFYMMAYDTFSSRSCPSTGVFEELIAHGASTMYPDDRELFKSTFSIENLMGAYNHGDRFVRLVTRQIGDDGIYRKVETVDYFVKNPSVNDVLVITLCQNLED
ncbi:MAG: EAL domain-containing protein [Ruminococcus sp.]|nr:EAL domain-containing protein [Ruminococcus sp.]